MMGLKAIYAQLSCSDLAGSIRWFASVFEREPDARPMPGLAEWHHDEKAGFQLFENKQNAGHGTLTLIVDDVRDQHTRLSNAGMEPGDVQPADYTTIVRLRDPDGNLVVLAQPGRA
jgi:catechol 2,3-dioxygenase-like lactoylglutathione lyase family enzyme